MFEVSNYNPDVLSCLANLSSDEVFTPPEVVNQMLDLLPAEIWKDEKATFLDPGTKSGVFLREIAKRLDIGLEEKLPDRQERFNHIMTKQLYGLAITELTAMLARRSLYCSKTADGKYSVCTGFKNQDGNIRFSTVKHSWENGRCIYCGASEKTLDREELYEAHAYEFIHDFQPKDKFKMNFDVIVGNPPYQLSDGGFGKSATPIYNHFVEQAIKLRPRYLTMIIPARWFGGGKGLADFRQQMLNDKRLRKIVDFEDSSDVFPGVSIAGGVCYFLWDRDNEGKCNVTNSHMESKTETLRDLNEFPIFIRDGAAVPIVRKILSHKEDKLSTQVSSYKPFGLRTYVKPQKTGDIKLFWQKGIGPYKRKDVSAGHEMIDLWKVVTSRSGNEHAGNPGNDGKRRVLSRVEILPPGTVCTETYLVVGSYKTKKEAENLYVYITTCFVRYLMTLFMFGHGITKDTFSLVPILDMKKRWDDLEIYARYKLTKAEINFIESKIKPMS